MVVRFFNRIIYLIYKTSRSYLIKHNNLVNKDDFDLTFWGDDL